MEKNLLEKRKQVLENLMKDKQYVPMKIKELAIILQIPRENRGELLEVLDELVKDGKIEQSKRGKYRIDSFGKCRPTCILRKIRRESL